MDLDRLALRTGKELQLVIAAAVDLPTTLAPHRIKRFKRKAKVAAGVGGAATVVAGGALWAANLGFWASLGAALGLASIPLLATLAGTGVLAMGLPGRKRGEISDYQRHRDQVELTFACFHLLAEADGRISEEERVVLRSVLLQFPLTDEDKEQIQQRSPDEVLSQAGELDEQIRRQVLQGTWMLAETDGVSPEEEEVFADLAAHLDLGDEARELKRQSRDIQASVNDLVTSMFRTCQHVLSPSLGQARPNEFLESLAHIAATPLVRRNLRNSLTSGFSAGGVGRMLDEHGEAQKLVAQAHNAVRAVYGSSAEELKAGRSRLLELAEGAAMGSRSARRICADMDALFDEALKAARQEEILSTGRPEERGPSR
jgi:tellurite resistance protein